MQKRKTIYLCMAHMSDTNAEQKYIKEAFDTNWIVPLGPNVEAFEKELCEYYGGQHPVCVVNSGTAAIHLGLKLLGVGPGDEVLAQTFTFCASANPIKYLGATPVFVDSEADTWNMSPEMLDVAIQDRIAKTGHCPKAIVAVCLYGMPSKIDEIIDVANKYGIPVLEDSAEAMGSLYKGKLCGTFSQFGIISFNGNKMITTSGGGALICPNEEYRLKALKYTTQSREPLRYYQHEDLGYNYRLSNVCAGIGRGQMTVLKEHLAHHKHVHKLYTEAFSQVNGIHVKHNPSADFDSNYWLTTILLDESVRVRKQGEIKEIYETDCQPAENVEALIVGLSERGIEARPLWKPMHCQPVFRDCPSYVNGVSESLFKIGVCLPSGPCVSDDDVMYIVETIKSLIE